jgi:hypothetical protein
MEPITPPKVQLFDKKAKFENWQSFTSDMPDGAAFACLAEFGLTYEDLEEFAE